MKTNSGATARREFLGLLLAAPLLPMTTRAVDADDLYEAAKREGTVHLYTGGSASGSASYVAAFKREFPGIDVIVTGAYSNVNDKLIDQQLHEKNVSADIVMFQTVQDFVAWKRAGDLLPFRFTDFALYAPRYTDPDGAFVASSLYPLTYGYNPAAVAPAAVPKSALDFLKPELHGKLITCYPHDDDATLYLFYTLSQKYGWDFIDRYMATDPSFVEGHLGVVQAIAAGRKAATFDCSAHTAMDVKNKGGAIEVAFSSNDPIPVFYTTNAILRAAPHPNAAKLFTNFFLSKEQQIATETWSPRRDVPPPHGLQPLSAYHLADGYRAFMVQTALIDDLRRRFLALTGPVVNKS
jgi:ABC-type Fe3+ transport system substrate-binding protein